MKRLLIFLPLLGLWLAACGAASRVSPQQSLAAPTMVPSATREPAPPVTVLPRPTDTAAPPADASPIPELPTPLPPEPTITPPPTLGPDGWKELPVIPQIGPTVRQVYLRGVELGNNPRAFSKVGDCGSTPAWFLGDFDRGPRYYRLGGHQDLEPVIQAFAGSWGRTSLAAKAGFNASSIFTVLWADRKQCQANETPLACEYRLNRPVFAFIMLGSNDVWHPDSFEPQMRKIIEFSMENGVVPILSTKADNDEGDGSINAVIARLALEYDLPLWNYWRAVQDLPDAGLQEDGVHLTWGPNRFDDPEVMKKAWPVRNLTALQTLDAVWKAAIADNP